MPMQSTQTRPNSHLETKWGPSGALTPLGQKLVTTSHSARVWTWVHVSRASHAGVHEQQQAGEP